LKGLPSFILTNTTQRERGVCTGWDSPKGGRMKEAREKIAKLLARSDNWHDWEQLKEYEKKYYRNKVNEILSRLKEDGWVRVEKESELPKSPLALLAGWHAYRRYYEIAQQDMVKAGWRKVVEE